MHSFTYLKKWNSQLKLPGWTGLYGLIKLKQIMPVLCTTKNFTFLNPFVKEYRFENDADSSNYLI